jgi:hypothetical protein
MIENQYLFIIGSDIFFPVLISSLTPSIVTKPIFIE